MEAWETLNWEERGEESGEGLQFLSRKSRKYFLPLVPRWRNKRKQKEFISFNNTGCSLPVQHINYKKKFAGSIMGEFKWREVLWVSFLS